jgi:hypothetical protein
MSTTGAVLELKADKRLRSCRPRAVAHTFGCWEKVLVIFDGNRCRKGEENVFEQCSEGPVRFS